MVKPGPKQPRMGDHFGTRFLKFGLAFKSPHLKKINDCKIFVPVLKKQRHERAKRVGEPPSPNK